MKFMRRFYGRLPRRAPDGRFEDAAAKVRRDMVRAETMDMTLELSRRETLAKSQMVAEVCYAGE